MKLRRLARIIGRDEALRPRATVTPPVHTSADVARLDLAAPGTPPLPEHEQSPGGDDDSGSASDE